MAVADFRRLQVGLSNYRDSTHYRDSLSLFTIVIVDYLTMHLNVILHEIYASLSAHVSSNDIKCNQKQ